MPSITETIQRLSKFSERENISNILGGLALLKSPSEAKDDAITSLRNQLNTILSDHDNVSVINNNLTIDQVAYDTLLALTEFKPVNDNDPITQDKIGKNDRVFVSTGHQFNINTLIKYHNTRDYRDSALQEECNSKWLLNPITNSKFSPRDVTHIKTIA